jgi:hypothetical protein
VILHRCIATLTQTVGGSFNGRTADSDSVDQGSNPCPPAIKQNGDLTQLSYVPILFPPFSIILAQESRKVTVRLNAGALSEESTGSVKK